MDLLRAEIERKKRAVEAAKKSSGDAVIITAASARSDGSGGGGGGGGGTAAASAAGGTKKKKQYLKSSDLRRVQERQEEEERKRREGGGEKKKKKKKKRRRRDDDEDGGGAAAAKKADGGTDKLSSDEAGRAGNKTGDRKDIEGGESGDGGGLKREVDASKGHEVDGGDGGGTSSPGGGSNNHNKRRRHDRSRDALSALTPSEVTTKLRELGLPVRLFGERTMKMQQGGKQEKEESTKTKYDDSQRIDRLHDALERRKVEMAGLSEMDEFRLGSGHGIRNPFLERGGGGEDVGTAGGGVASSAAAASAVDGGTAAAAAAASSGGKSDRGTAKADGGAKKGGDNTEKEVEDDPHKKIHRFFKSLLKQWEDDLAHRPDDVKRTAAGRNETKTFKQCKDYIRPLFKLCKTRRLEPGMMAHILRIVDFCEQGEFVKANDSYIDVAIGRAAWPIGVTMVGIHARSGREKIGSSNVAHVMNNELQRKYLTSVKRLMSYCQNTRPDVDPSKKCNM